MTISVNYQYMQWQIADDLGDRQDLLTNLSDSSLTVSPIQLAIQSAIAKWEREPFYFLQSFTTLFTTVAGQEFYTSSDAAAIATAPNIVKLRVLVNNQRYSIEKRTWSYLEDVSTNPSVTSSYPSDWAYFAEQIRLYPIPSQVIPIQGSFDQRLTNLLNPTDVNVWTEDAFDLIRAEAKLILARSTLHDPDLAQEMHRQIYGDPEDPRSRGYLSALKGESMRRAASRHIRPTHF